MTATKRRWVQFSLRTLFVVVTAFSIALGAWSWLEPPQVPEARLRQIMAVRKALLHDTISAQDARVILGDEVAKLKAEIPIPKR